MTQSASSPSPHTRSRSRARPRVGSRRTIRQMLDPTGTRRSSLGRGDPFGRSEGGNLTRSIDARDGRCVLFALSAASCAVLLGGAIPLRRLRRGTLLLNRSTRGGTAGRAANRTRQTLVAAQIALGLVALAGSGLLVRSFLRVSAVRPGFDVDHVATYWMSLPPCRYAKDTAIARFYTALLDRARAVPGVVSVGPTSRLPLVPRGFNDNPFYVEGALSTDEKLPPLRLFTTVGGDYPNDAHSVIGGKILRTDGSTAGGRCNHFEPHRLHVLARLDRPFGGRQELWRASDEPLVDRHWRRSEHTRFVVDEIAGSGRVLPADRVHGSRAAPNRTDHGAGHAHTKRPVFAQFRGARQRPRARSVAAVVRRSTDGHGGSGVDGATAFYRARAWHGTPGQLILGALGLYGVMGYVVALRRREIGIRIALGAAPNTVAAATTRGAMRVTSIGLAVGLALFGVAAWDPVAMTGAVVILLVAVMLASWLPARRAAQVDPAEALRAEA
jgi:putative ABC transport system permease protein